MNNSIKSILNAVMIVSVLMLYLNVGQPAPLAADAFPQWLSFQWLSFFNPPP